VTSELQISGAEPVKGKTSLPSHRDGSKAGQGDHHSPSSPCSASEPGGRPMAPAAENRRTWSRSFLIFGLASAILLWAFRTEIGTAMALWANSSSFGHAFFIFPITGFLIFRKRDTLANLTPRAAPSGLIPFITMSFLWVLGDLANIMVVRQLAFVGIWQSLFLIVMGWRVTWSLLFPLAYLFLAVPLGSEIIPLLQDVTAQIVVHLLRVTGMPVFLDGYHIQIPSGNFLVAEACSGLRFLIVCIALGLLIAHLFFRSWPKRILFVGLSIAVPIIANGIRAYGIIMLAHLSDYRLAADVDHVIYGFIFLSVIILILIGLAALLRDRIDPETMPATVSASPPRTTGHRIPVDVGQLGLATLAMATIFFAQSWAAMAKAPPQGPLAPELYSPDLSPQWTVVETAELPWSARFAPTDAILVRSYSDGTTEVDLQVAFYAYQREGAEALSELNTLLTGESGWRMVGRQLTTRQVGSQSIPIIEVVVQNDGDSRLVWYWYQIGGSSTNSRIIGKLLELKSMLLAQDRAAAVVVVSADMVEDRQAAASAIERFLEVGLVEDKDLVLVKE